MKKTLLFSLLLIGCSEASFESVKQTCTVTQTEITCPDGSSMPLPRDGRDGAPGIDGRDGLDGIDGKDGEPGTMIDIIDPCGDGPGHDEVILRFDNGLFLAWYLDLGFTVLDEGRVYQTTDQQQCKFQILANEVVTL
jgi:hypothetical protein